MYVNLLFSFFSLLITIKAFSTLVIEKEEFKQEIIHNEISKDQDMPAIIGIEDNPLKGFSGFNFFITHPTTSEKNLEQIQNSVEKELGKYGSIKKLNMLVRTTKGNAVDPTVLIRGGHLSYEINNVRSDSGKILPFIRASLHLKSYVTIDKTKENCRAYVWSKSCYLPGDVNKNTATLISNSLNTLLSKFIFDYSLINKEKPTFYLVSP